MTGLLAEAVKVGQDPPGYTPRAVLVGLLALSALFWLPPLLRWSDQPRRPREPRAWRRLLWAPGAGVPGSQPAPPPAIRRQRRVDAGWALPGRGTRAVMPRPAQPHSAFYDAYIRHGARSPYTGLTWQQTREHLLDLNVASHGGRCQLGIVCGGLAAGTQLDHCARSAGWPHDYSRLGQEGPTDCRPVCRDCHVRREQLKRQGADAWQWRDAR